MFFSLYQKLINIKLSKTSNLVLEPLDRRLVPVPEELLVVALVFDEPPAHHLANLAVRQLRLRRFDLKKKCHSMVNDQIKLVLREWLETPNIEKWSG